MDINNEQFIGNLLQAYLEEKRIDLPEGWLKKIVDLHKKDEVELIRTEIKKKSVTIGMDDIIHFYMNYYSEIDQKQNGIYYTPINIVELMNTFLLDQYEAPCIPNVIDPAVGAGMYIYKIAIKLSEKFECQINEVIEKNIYGIDIMSENILMTKCILAITSYEICQKIPMEFNLLIADSLSLNEEQLNEELGISKFDIVVTNPPYVRSKHIEKSVKNSLKNYSNSVFGVSDLYIPFFELGVKLLKEDGLAGYITPNTFFRSLNGKKIREYLKANTKFIKLVDFGSEQLFNDIQSYTAVSFFQKKSTSIKDDARFYFYRMDNFNFELHENYWHQFQPSDSWIPLDRLEQQIISKLEKSFELRLGDLNIKNGIATQRNGIYSFSYSEEDENYYYFFDGTKRNAVEKEITRPFILPNTNDRDPNLRIIFPYRMNDEKSKAAPIRIEEMKELFPKCLEYLIQFKDELALRKVDKNLKYWYLYGRSQGLNMYGNRLYLPYMAKNVKTIMSEQDDEIFAAGYAIFDEPREYLAMVSSIIESKLFSFYISKVSKPYSNKYYSTAKKMIQNFSIPTENDLNNFEKEQLNIFKLYELYNFSEDEQKYIESIDF